MVPQKPDPEQIFADYAWVPPWRMNPPLTYEYVSTTEVKISFYQNRDSVDKCL